MNIQVPFDLLGDYVSIALETDNSFYQLTVRYQSTNIAITLNNHEIAFYDFKSSSVEGNTIAKEVLHLLIEHFKKLGYVNNYRRK